MRKYAMIFALPLIAASAAQASIAYAPNNLHRPTSGPDSLISFDTNNPAAYTVIGSMGVDNIGFGGMAFDAGGNLWAYASSYKSTGGAASGLYSVNMNTGAATLIGNSYQTLDDIAYNPMNGTMYGVRTQNTVTRLYTIDLATGATTTVGALTGLGDLPSSGGLAIDSTGSIFVLDMNGDKIYKSAGLDMTELYALPQNVNYSQGIDIDWSRDDFGYHAAVGYGEYPHYFSQLNIFLTDGAAYGTGPSFGPELPDGLPPVECGDIAIMPVPEPSSIALLALGGLLLRRRAR